MPESKRKIKCKREGRANPVEFHASAEERELILAVAQRCIVLRYYKSQKTKALRKFIAELNEKRPEEKRVIRPEGKELLSPRGAYTWDSRAMSAIQERSGRDPDIMRAESCATFESILRDPTSSSRDRIAAQKALNDLYGLDATKQLVHSLAPPQTRMVVDVVDNSKPRLIEGEGKVIVKTPEEGVA